MLNQNQQTCDKNMCLLLYKLSDLRNNFTFITDPSLHKPLIWVPELNAPKINKTMLKSH